MLNRENFFISEVFRRLSLLCRFRIQRMVRYANVMTPQARAAGRTGMGAVMGSKNLKAIAVRGSKSIAVARPDEYIDKYLRPDMALPP